MRPSPVLAVSRALAWVGAIAACCCLALPAVAEDLEVSISVPEGVPLGTTASDFSNSDAEARGGVLVINLSGSIRFENLGHDPVRGLALRIVAGEGAFGGLAGITVPSLHAPRGDGVDVQVSLTLLRPLPVPRGPAVVIEPDSVLFASMKSAGPNRLGAASKLSVLETEARRDRAFFLARLNSGGTQALAAEMQASLRRQAARPRLSVQLAGDGPATAGRPSDPRNVEIAFLDIPGAPIVADGGTATGQGALWEAPSFELRNRSGQTVNHLDVGWLATSETGELHSLGSAPLAGRSPVPPGTPFAAEGKGTFRVQLPEPAKGSSGPVSMSAFLRSAGMEDGTVWVPSRHALETSGLIDAVPVSAEELRLSQLYRERGARAVSEELRRFAAAD